MTQILEFMGNHPIMSVIIIYMIICFFELPFKLTNRLIRHMNIRKAGWPPEHLDADGDLKPEKETK